MFNKNDTISSEIIQFLQKLNNFYKKTAQIYKKKYDFTKIIQFYQKVDRCFFKYKANKYSLAINDTIFHTSTILIS